MIEINGLSVVYKMIRKKKGIKDNFKLLFNPQYVYKEALTNINTKIGDGEIVGLVGTNGAGKTTLIKVLSGIIYPTKGNVVVDAYIPSERNKEYRRKIALLLGQKSKLIWDVAATESFRLYKTIYNIPDNMYKVNLDYLVNLLDVSHCLDTPVRQLSLGERMKMEFICSLIYEPQIIFLDEPTIGLDLKSQIVIRNFIKEYAQKTNATIIITSHNMQDIDNICKRVMILNKGDIIYDDSCTALNSSGDMNKTIKFSADHLLISGNIKEDIQDFVYEDEIYKISVKADKVNELVSTLLASNNIRNLTIENFSLEERILKIMEGT